MMLLLPVLLYVYGTPDNLRPVDPNAPLVPYMIPADRPAGSRPAVTGDAVWCFTLAADESRQQSVDPVQPGIARVAVTVMEQDTGSPRILRRELPLLTAPLGHELCVTLGHVERFVQVEAAVAPLEE